MAPSEVPFLLAVYHPEGSERIDLDERGWLETHAEKLDKAYCLALVPKHPGLPNITMWGPARYLSRVWRRIPGSREVRAWGLTRDGGGGIWSIGGMVVEEQDLDAAAKALLDLG